MELKKLKQTLNNNIEVVLKKLNIEYTVFNDNLYSTCPIHGDSDNPRAFSFSTTKNIWKCWTRDCQSNYTNDIFGLINGVLATQENKEIEFSDIIRWSCNTLNLNAVSYSNSEDTELEDEYFNIAKSIKPNLLNINDKVLESDFVTHIPSDYFYDRGFKKATLKYFGVGDCVNEGIMKERAIIPIHNDDGTKIIGAIGRSIKEYRTPKFLIYPKGFDKRYYFYNYHRAIEKAKNTSCLYILEGQGDVWKMYEAGVHNAVSIFGKTISKEQVNKLNRLPITKLIIIMDNDQAGREARMTIQRQLSRMYTLIFPTLSHKDVGDMDAKKIKEHILSKLEGTY